MDWSSYHFLTRGRTLSLPCIVLLQWKACDQSRARETLAGWSHMQEEIFSFLILGMKMRLWTSRLFPAWWAEQDGMI